MSVTRPSSTPGSSASCWALLKRWISSRKRIVRRPVAPSRSRALPRTPRTSATLADTAESSSNSAPVTPATMRASVVFPLPGGPYRIVEPTRSSSIASRSADPSPRTWRWPTNSSSVFGRSRRASGATAGSRSRAASEKRSPTPEVCSGHGRRGVVRAASGGGLLAADPPRRGRERLRALPPHRCPARAPEDAGGAGPPRRAPLPDRPPVVRALAEARRDRGRDRDRAPARARDPARAAAAAARGPVPPVHHRTARHAGADVALGVPDDPQGARAREWLRLARLPRRAAGLARPRRGLPRAPPRGRRLDRRPVRARPRVRGPLPARGGADRVGRASDGLALPPLQSRVADHRRRGRRHAGDAGRAAREPDQEEPLSGALARPERDHRAVERGGLMAFEELKERQGVIWGSPPFEDYVWLAEMHDDLVDRLDPQPGERWLDVATGTGEVAFRAAEAGADVTG